MKAKKFMNTFCAGLGVTICLIAFSACDNQNIDDNVPNQDSQYSSECDTVISQNPNLTSEYLNDRQLRGDFTYFIIDTLIIENAIILSYSDGKMQLDMITSMDLISGMELDELKPWRLLSRRDVYLKGLGGRDHHFLSNINTLVSPEHMPEIRTGIRTQYYSVFPLIQREFLMVIIDEATYMLTEAVEDLNSNITKHTVGLPLKMAYPLVEN